MIYLESKKTKFGDDLCFSKFLKILFKDLHVNENVENLRPLNRLRTILQFCRGWINKIRKSNDFWFLSGFM